MTLTKENNKCLTHVALLLLAVGIAYFKIFHAGFISWDDNEYVTNNPDITGINANTISAWCSRFYIGNYHPLTMLSYAIDYLIGGKDPFIYHLTNLILHAGNAIIVYLIINRLQPDRTIALFVALLFALHPMHTETVSWIAERKTLLCALFYFLAMLRYTGYVALPSAKGLIIVGLLGVAAILSKAVGVALPLSLFAIDIWLRRDMRACRVWLEKIPLLLIAFIAGLVAIRAQAEGRFLNLHTEYSIWDTIIFAGFAYIRYIVHFLFPYQLSVIYPYPQIGWVQYLYLLLSLAIVVLAVMAWRRKWYVLCGSIVFFTVNIGLLLQFVQFGEFLMADRYLYIACVGILFPLVFYLFRWLRRVSGHIVAYIAGGALALTLLVMTFIRNDIWLSDFNFFSAILDAFPDSAVAQYSVGGLYMRQGNYTEAEQHINIAVSLDPGNYKAWYDKGALYLREGKAAESLEALNRCLAINEYSKAYFSRALLYQGTGQPALALADIDKVLADQPNNAHAYYIKADCLEQQGDIKGAMDNYTHAIANDSREPLFFIRRGLAYSKTHQDAPALSDLNTALGLNPASGEALYFRGIVKYHGGLPCCDDFRNALTHGYKKAGAALAQICGR